MQAFTPGAMPACIPGLRACGCSALLELASRSFLPFGLLSAALLAFDLHAVLVDLRSCQQHV